jgi:hypothetical protein
VRSNEPEREQKKIYDYVQQRAGEKAKQTDAAQQILDIMIRNTRKGGQKTRTVPSRR